MATSPRPIPPRPTSPGRASPNTHWVLSGLAVGLVVGLVVVAVLLVTGTVTGASPTGAGTGTWAAGGASGTGSGPATHLDAGLQATFEEAAADAARDGVGLTLTSGWRSADDQQELVDAAVEHHGSAAAARRWVLPPEASAHVAGLAIDVGPAAGALWLDARSQDYGLCRTYANELWHFEPVVERGGTCPPMHEDASGGWEDGGPRAPAHD